MAATQNQKKKKLQKRKKRQQRKPQKKQRQSNLNTKKVKHPSKTFAPKLLQNLCQRKASHLAKANENAIFTQRCILTTQDGQKQCYLSNYMSSSVGPRAGSPALIWPGKASMTSWPATMCTPQPNSLNNHLWQAGQQCILNNTVPSPALCGKMGSNICTLSSKDLQYEGNEMVPRQLIQCVFANDPNAAPF